MNAETPKTYRIAKLEIENFKKVRAVSIKPGSAMVEVTGRNAQGKSSVLDAIWVALAGKSVAPIMPVRAGAERAVIRLDLGDLLITRVFTAQDDGAYTTSIRVENADGARYTSPKAILDGLFGELTFDPLEFERSKPVEQFEMLKRFVPSFDFDANSKARKEAYDARTGANRRAKDLRAQAEGIVVPAGASVSLLDETELLDALASAAEFNTVIDQRASNRAEYLRRTEELQTERDNLATRIAEIDAILPDRRAKFAALVPLPEKIDIAATRDQLEKVRCANEAARMAQRRAELEKAAANAEAESAALTKVIDDGDAARLKAIEAADIPVRGISFGDELVLLNGVPFSQASDAERLSASVSIAMAANTRLRVVRIREGSRLDETAVRLIAEMAEEKGFQVWMETVDSRRPAAIQIEDGAVVANLEAAE